MLSRFLDGNNLRDARFTKQLHPPLSAIGDAPKSFTLGFATTRLHKGSIVCCLRWIRRWPRGTSVSGLAPDPGQRCPSESVGVDFGCAWLTLEHVRVLGLRADADAAVAGSACT